MAFLRTSAYLDDTPIIAGGGVVLRPPEMRDYWAWARLRQDSRDFLEPWEPLWPRDDLTRGAFRYRIKRYQRDLVDDVAYAFFVFREGDGELVGGLSLSNIRRGVAQTATLGYWIGEPHARRGHMSAAVRAVVPFAFDTLRLHRLEAACLPSNAASMGLLLKCGFAREGYARGYLKIAGRWQDHVLFALLDSDPPPARG